MSDVRIEKDTMGEVRIPSDAMWGPQTARSLEHFHIGEEHMPVPIIRSFAYLKAAAAKVNHALGIISGEQKKAIVTVCDEILHGHLNDAFPLYVWQTGSGTQTNMNVNEVIAHRGNMLAGKTILHPNDTVNASQSSNDTFPTALHIACALMIRDLIPVIQDAIDVLDALEKEYVNVRKIGRTHLMDAVPLTFGQEISGWKEMLTISLHQINTSMDGIYSLAIGGTAVGTGLNAPEGFGDFCAKEIADETGLPFVSASNKFHALTSHDGIVFAHGAIKALAADLMKIANDIRWLASGPRCGLSEIRIPANEPGSSIMPGKVNPTQCEAMTMIAVQVIGNDTTIGVAASQGNFELNVFLPVIAYNFCQSVGLLHDGISSFTRFCLSGIEANRDVMQYNMEHSLMLVTALSPHIGYDQAAKVAKYADEMNCTLKEACMHFGFMDEETYDAIMKEAYS